MKWMLFLFSFKFDKQYSCGNRSFKFLVETQPAFVSYFLLNFRASCFL